MSVERTLIFDGRCGFCTRIVEWALAHAREPFVALPFQSIEPDRYGLTIEQAQRSVWWIEGNVELDGARAIARLLRACKEPWPTLGRVMRVPPLSWASALGYRAVARLRGHLPGVRPACDGPWDPSHGRVTA